MSFSKEEIEKIYQIREKMLITYKAAVSDAQKKRISKDLAKIEKIIGHIEEGKEIEVDKLSLFSIESRNTENNVKKEEHDNRISYIAKIEILKLSDSNKDPEMNQIYSFLIFFENNFAVPLDDMYLKLEYSLGKKRDIIFAHYQALQRLLKEYIDDIEILQDLKIKEQIEKYKSRIEQQKAYLLIKLSEFLHELKDLVNEIISDYKSGKSNFLNPKEKFQTSYLIKEKTEFEDMEMIDILYETVYFLEDFIEIIRMPDFRKNLKIK